MFIEDRNHLNFELFEIFSSRFWVKILTCAFTLTYVWPKYLFNFSLQSIKNNRRKITNSHNIPPSWLTVLQQARQDGSCEDARTYDVYLVWVLGQVLVTVWRFASFGPSLACFSEKSSALCSLVDFLERWHLADFVERMFSNAYCADTASVEINVHLRVWHR